MFRFIKVAVFLFCFLSLAGQDDLSQAIHENARKAESQVIEWRRHFHKYPELSNREFKTAGQIAAILREMGLQVDTGIAHTGVVGVLEGKGAGPVFGLRADIDGLPVTERVDLPFASKEKTTYLGEEVGVMHACGHDTHIAMLLGAAHVLSGMKNRFKGKVVFVFQPAEEGPPPGEKGGAQLMVEEGLLDKYGIEVMFGQHIGANLDVGKIQYRIGGYMAASDRFVIKVRGVQTHGSRPWQGVDPITVSAQIILGLQNIVSRQTELTKHAAVISVGKIKGGFRSNIIPEEVEMIGTIRTLDAGMRSDIHNRIVTTATRIAESAGAVAEVEIGGGIPVTVNDPVLTRKVIKGLFDAAGEDNVIIARPRTGAEDFSFFANEIPSLFYRVGGKSPDISSLEAPDHHTPDFYIDESGMILGVKAFVHLVFTYMKDPLKN